MLPPGIDPELLTAPLDTPREGDPVRWEMEELVSVIIRVGEDWPSAPTLYIAHPYFSGFYGNHFLTLPPLLLEVWRSNHDV